MRTNGVLMHISSLPSPYGIGTLGKGAYDFVDFLKKAGQTYWQILPIGPTSYGDSPYAAFSTFAGNPYFIDLDKLQKDGLLKKEEYCNRDWNDSEDSVNYGKIYNSRFDVLKLAANRFKDNDEYKTFCKENEYWLDNYAQFMTLKNLNCGKSWLQWNITGTAGSEAQVRVWKVIQYLFYRQWAQLKEYANKNGIEIIGDLPIYVALDSADVWSHPELFQLQENHEPKDVAGCPPDAFSQDGQLWGNPLFDWDKMAEDDYDWWLRRIMHMCHTYDVLRIDHFRGFAGYFAIPYGDKNARRGIWRKGPGFALFAALEKKYGRQKIVVEDLGEITPDVRELLVQTGYPGMKPTCFAFNADGYGESEYLPHSFIKNCVGYVGSHDNDTIMGLKDSLKPADVEMIRQYYGITDDKDFNWAMMRGLWMTVADTTVVQAQDLLGLDNHSRMNAPSTTGTNWKWRALPGDFNDELAKKIYGYMRIYGRLNRGKNEI